MHKRTRPLLILALFSLALVALLAGGASFSSTFAATVPDDELAYIDNAGRVAVTDPQVAPGMPAFSYVSPSGGYTDLAVIDANRDGIAEIVGIAGPTARILLPAGGGAGAPQFEKTVAGYSYNLVAVGDVTADGHQDIILQRTVIGGVDSVVEVWQNNGSGTNWTQIFTLPAYGYPWLRIATGDVDGLAGDEMVMMRNGPLENADERIVIMTRSSGGQWVTILNRSFDWPWVDMAVGNAVTQVNGNMAEIVTSRDVIGLATIIFFQYSGNQLNDAPNGTFSHWPYFYDIALGDVNNSGDQETFFLRDPRTPNGVTLLAKNFGADPISATWINGLVIGREWLNIETGDINGDGKVDVVIASATAYRAYTDVSAGTTTTGNRSLAFRTFPVVYGFDSSFPTNRVAFKLGNFDGDGVNMDPPRLQINKSTIDFSMTRDGAAPPTQTFTASNTGGGALAIHVDARTLNGGDWLDVTPFDATAPATFTVGVKNTTGMAAGTYDATITVEGRSSTTVQNSPQVIQVRLTIRPTGPILEATPASFTWEHNFGDPTPAAQALNIRNTGDGGARSYQISVSTSDGGDWLRTNKNSGFTNDVVQVSVDVHALRPGNYSGQIVVTAAGMSGSPATLPVTLRITATGMVVTPRQISLLAIKGQPNPSPVEISILNSVDDWYAYAVPSGDWWALQAALDAGEVEAAVQEQGLAYTGPDGATHLLSTLDWVLLTPNRGPSPGRLQVSIDSAAAPLGFHRVTILIDGGPNSVNRFQGVDAQMLVADALVWLPSILR